MVLDAAPISADSMRIMKVSHAGLCLVLLLAGLEVSDAVLEETRGMAPEVSGSETDASYPPFHCHSPLTRISWRYFPVKISLENTRASIGLVFSPLCLPLNRPHHHR